MTDQVTISIGGSNSAFSCFIHTDFDEIVNHANLTLNNYNRLIFIKRYLSFLIITERRRSLFKLWYYFIRIFIQTGTLLTPAILSLQLFSSYVIAGTFIAWITWGMMVMVAIFNSMVGIFDLDRKLVLYSTATEALQQEIWKYLEISGEYSEFPSNTTHNDLFHMFCTNMEHLIYKITNMETTFLQKNVLQSTTSHGRTSLNLRRGSTPAGQTIGISNNCQSNTCEGTDSPIQRNVPRANTSFRESTLNKSKLYRSSYDKDRPSLDRQSIDRNRDKPSLDTELEPIIKASLMSNSSV